MVLYILREVRASVVLRLGNLQVANIFNDGEWRFRRNWLRRNDRDMAMLAWALDRERRERGCDELTALHKLCCVGLAVNLVNKNQIKCKREFS